MIAVDQFERGNNMMKTVLKKVMSCVLSVCMLAGSLVLTAQATPNGSEQIGKYVTVGKDNVAGTQTNGTTTSTVTGSDGVELQKNIAPVVENGKVIENLFDITLQVKTQQSVTSHDAAVAIVIDTSGSMAYCAECGQEWYHASTCKYYSKYDNDNDVTTAQSRMNATIAGAKAFVAALVKDSSNTGKIYVSVIQFASTASKVSDWTDITTSAGKKSVEDAIDSLEAGGGTNLEAGLMLARNRLNMKAAPVGGKKTVNISALSKYTVLLTDGQPTYHVKNETASTEYAGTFGTGGTGGDGGNTTEAERNEAKAMATQVKTLGSKLYTICYGVSKDALYETDPCVNCGKTKDEHWSRDHWCPDYSGKSYQGTTVTVGDYLKNEIASTATEDATYAFSANNTNDLNKAFSSIASSTISGINASGATVSDPMAEKIVFQTGTDFTGNSAQDAQFNSQTNTLEWTLNAEHASTNTNSSGVTTYTYTVTYRIALDTSNLVPDQYYPTNKYTSFTYGENELAFKVPTVKGMFGTFSFNKVAYHNNNLGLGGAVFTMVRNDNQVTRTATSNSNGSVTFTNLPSGTYTLTETTAANGYDKTTASSYTVVVSFGEVSVQNVSGALTITNKLLQKKTSVSGTKTWVDGNGKGRPESITVILNRDGKEAARQTVTAANKWAYSFTDLDQINLETGKDYVYTVQEIVPKGYENTVNGNNLTNTLEQKKISVSGSKVWVDGNNALNTRPDSVTLELFANGVSTGKTVVTNSAKQWAYSFTGLDQYDAARFPITYTVQEKDTNSDYTATIGNQENNYKVTNTIKQEKITVSGSKAWVDNGNAENTRPASVTLSLYANGSATGNTTTTTAADSWNYSFTGLDKFDSNGAVITYTVKEVNTSSLYTAQDGNAGNQFTVTNTIKQQKTSVSVRKAWVIPEGTQKPAVTISLNNGSTSLQSVTLNGTEATPWQHTFTNLDVYDLTTGAKINYTVSETAINGYNNNGAPTITGNMTDGFVVTNTLDQEKITISGTKTWVDNNNTYNTRPETITFNLYRNGSPFDSQQVSKTANGYSFTDLDRYDANRQPYTYTVKEEAVKGYTSAADQSGFNFTNTIAQQKTSVAVSKTWIAPDALKAAVTINLKQNGTVIANVTLDGTVDSNETAAWQYTFVNLDVYDATGTKYVYTVEEATKLANFNAPEITGSAAEGFVITNRVTQKVTSVSGSKTWIDNGNAYNTRPETITIELYRDNAFFKSTAVSKTAAGYTFDQLEVYAADGHEYSYTVKEADVEGYTSEQNGNNFINTVEQSKTDVSVTKVWVAPANMQSTVKINLLKNGQIADSVTLNGTETAAWQHTFSDLDVYDLETGAKYTYTVEEETQLADFDDAVISGTAADGFAVTNTVSQDTTAVTGKKTWIDPKDTVHPTITITLYRDNAVYQTVDLENGKTDYSFTNLPVYALDSEDEAKNDGHIYVYTVKESTVEGYTSAQDGNNFINTIDQDYTKISGTKTWIDPEDTEHATLTITLKRDGAVYKTTELKNGETDYSFSELPVYALDDEDAAKNDGHRYVYTVEESAVEGYTSAQDGNNFINTIDQDYTEISGTKTWINPGTSANPTITINLLRDGAVYQSVELHDGETTYQFTELPVYDLDVLKDGHRFAYTVEEENVEGYTSAQDGNNFTNTIAQQKISVSGTKTWEDVPEDETLPEVTIILNCDGKEIARTIMNTTTGWTYAFNELDRYDLTDGHEYQYTVAEVPVEGYTTEQDGFNFTNIYEEEIVESNPPLVGPSSEPEESIPDNDIPLTGGVAVAGGALGVFAAAAAAAIWFGKRKKEDEE